MSPPNLKYHRQTIMAAKKEFHFPSDVFALIKSFTKPNIWQCEACGTEEDMKVAIPKFYFTNPKSTLPGFKNRERTNFCESCVDNYQCYECQDCTVDGINDCEGCNQNCCNDCIKQCELCSGDCFNAPGSAICEECGGGESDDE